MNVKVVDKITIVVPTFNRYRFLLRLLKYYRSCGSPFPMHILDSSSEAWKHSELEELVHSPNVMYTKYDSHVRPIPKLYDGLQKITTPYVVIWADDDLMVPRSFEYGVRFLEEHRDFSVVHGPSGAFNVELTQGNKAVPRLWPYEQRSITDETASSRLTNCLGNYTTVFYSIHRTENLQSNMEQCCLYGFGLWWAELGLACLSIIQGKAKRLDCLYMMREKGSETDSWSEGKKLDIFDWVTSASFPSNYEGFRTCLSEALAHQDNIGLSEARELVKQAFWAYLARNLDGRYAQASAGTYNRLRQVARRIPGARRVWRALRSLSLGGRDEISLPALLHPSSLYHNGFMPIYRAITTPPASADLQSTKRTEGDL